MDAGSWGFVATVIAVLLFVLWSVAEIVYNRKRLNNAFDQHFSQYDK